MLDNLNRRNKWFWGWLIQMTVAKSEIHNLSAKVEVWKNLVLVQAINADEAYRKAIILGKSEAGDCHGTLRLNGKPATVKFLGVSDMGLIYDELGDGVEILWQLKKCKQGSARSLIVSKSRLISRLKKA